MSVRLKASLSREFLKFAPFFAQVHGPILDAPCGYGRHAFYLRNLGCAVTCVDIDAAALNYIEDEDKNLNPHSDQKLNILNLDLVNGDWFFDDNSLGGLVNVHFMNAGFIDRVIPALKYDGLIYIETIANRGGNYLEMPNSGQIKEMLSGTFELLHYVEKPAGPVNSGKATVKVFARKCGK